MSSPGAPDAAEASSLASDLAAARLPLVVVAPADLVAATLAPESWLPEAERADIQRHLQPQDRTARFAAWGLARLLLGSLTGRSCSSLAMVRSRTGRPALSPRGPDFNLSHAGGWVAVGVTEEGRIGVDVEQARLCGIWDSIAADFLSASELSLWRQLAPEARAAGALRLWCIKEAILKATGEGLAGDARSIHVGLPGDAAPVLRQGRAHQIQVQALAGGLCLACAVTPPASIRVHVLGPGDAGSLRRLMQDT